MQYSKMKIPVVFSVSSANAETVKSRIDELEKFNTSKRDYIFIILCVDVNCLKKLDECINDNSEYEVRVVCVSDLLRRYQIKTLDTCYLKIISPFVVEDYDRLIFVGDSVRLFSDIGAFYDVSLNDSYIAGVPDLLESAVANDQTSPRYSYVRQYLRIADPQIFFNTDLFILNAKKIRENFTLRYLLELSDAKCFERADFDLLNVLVNGDISWQNSKWNHILLAEKDLTYCKKNLPLNFVSEFIESKDDFCVQNVKYQSVNTNLLPLGWPKKKKIAFKYYKYCLLSSLAFGIPKIKFNRRKQYYKDLMQKL